MENKSFSDVVSRSKAPFTTRLAANCGLAANFHAEAHPSLPDYLAMTSGSTHGVSDDHSPSSHHIRGPSIFSQLGSNWRALEESMPRSCDRSSSGRYAVRHNPAAYYTGLTRTCGERDVPLKRLPDISARFTFITPNLCHDTHDCGVGTGDRFLAVLIPRIVKSRQYRDGHTAIFITYDENDGGAGNRIPTIVISPSTKPGTVSRARFDHYSLLRTTEDMLALAPIAGAARAASMRAAFRL